MPNSLIVVFRSLNYLRSTTGTSADKYHISQKENTTNLEAIEDKIEISIYLVVYTGEKNTRWFRGLAFPDWSEKKNCILFGFWSSEENSASTVITE